MLKQVKPENLAVYIGKIDTIFPDFRHDSAVTPSDISRYYSESFWGYAIFHSWAGAIHMALSERGTFSKNDYFRQAEKIERRLGATGDITDVLEIGCGRGFNLAYLAQRFPNIRFTGIDISDVNVKSAQQRLTHLANASVQMGDFQELTNLTDGQFGLVFAIETLCHATKMSKAFLSIARVIAPGGKLIVFDGFRNHETAHDQLIQTAVVYSEKAMAVPKFWTIQSFNDLAAKSGLNVEYAIDLSMHIMPNLIRLSDFAKAFFKMPLLSKGISNVLPRGLVTNSIAGILMAITVQTGAHKYMELSFIKSC